MECYWDSGIGAAESGYFSFLANLEYCVYQNLCTEPKWDEYKWRLIEAIIKHNQPFEINTSGYSKVGRPFPEEWIAKELISAGVPTLLSCDSHETAHIGRGFEEGEVLLSKLGCKHRFKMSK